MDVVVVVGRMEVVNTRIERRLVVLFKLLLIRKWLRRIRRLLKRRKGETEEEMDAEGE